MACRAACSHGRGVPRAGLGGHHRRTTGRTGRHRRRHPERADPAPSRATAGARGCVSSRTRSRFSPACCTGKRLARRWPSDRQHRVAEVGGDDVTRPGDGGSPSDPAPAGPRRSGRDAEVRLRRGLQGARAGVGAGDRGPGGGGRVRQVAPFSHLAWSCSATSSSWGPSSARASAGPALTTGRRWMRLRCAVSTPRRSRPWSPRSRRRCSDGDSLGGSVEVLAYGVPVGLGSHVHWDRKIDGLLCQALMKHPGRQGGGDRRGDGRGRPSRLGRP